MNSASSQCRFSGHTKPWIVVFANRNQAIFAKRLSMMLRSGMPIVRGLNMILEGSNDRSSAYIYFQLIQHVQNGNKLSSAMRRFQGIFGEFSIHIVEVGEASGTLHQNLGYLAEELKKREYLRKKVIGALIYPAVVVCATIGIVLMLTMYIFPKIVPVFAGFKTGLPFATRVLIAASDFLSQYGLALLLGTIASSIAAFFLIRIRSVHAVADKILMRLPIFGTLSRACNLANAARTISLLLKAEIPIVDSLVIVEKNARNLAYRDAFANVRDTVMRGESVSTALRRYRKLFPNVCIEMIHAGEQTGNLESSFEYMATMYEEEIEDITRNLTTLIEPILMVVMGVTVGFIALSIIAPIYGITNQFSI